ncbi:uncharacterized protein K452DRAFT_315297 [Aplosporella prunicola CBS 121167]|uniref:Mis6 domain-containing protein n=1 Tax=Aplosporella prunicola CBS 121167 TaxID=1176127 RepID=A0A6A6BRW9_9PEZI|nr:uncharacterized protein K452DRAFT_315297 [Aplosporella prunicola CBS 121167]KAF2146035.1 hypothetical protein K452DRAFT_315297 [Aplosporella prunicola CBS 121167]
MPALPDSLSTAIDALRIASSTPPKQRPQSVAAHVDAVCSHAYQNGLARDQLKAIVAIVTRKARLDQTSQTNLVKNLYPADRISSEIITTVVCGLGQGQAKPSSATQSALVKWLIAVLDVLEDATILSKLYGLIFNLLDMLALRTPLCHLLSLITRRKHVRPFRIQQLLELVRATAQDPALVGLLRVYKDYYPDIIIGNAATSRASLPTPSQDEWRQRLHAIQEANAERAERVKPHQNGFKVIRRGAKRSKASIVPEVHTSRAHETSVTLDELDTADDLIKSLDKVELPNQILASLKDPLLQKYLILKSSDVAARRLEFWLECFLRDALDATADGSGAPSDLNELLEGLLSYTKATKILLPIVQEFFKSYLTVWNGSDCSAAVIGLLSFLPIQTFDGFRDTYLKPAEIAIVSSGTDDAYERLLDLYTQLTRKWAHAANNDGKDASGQPQPGGPLSQNFANLTTHISTTILSILSSVPLTTNTATSTLTFYSTLATLSTPITPLTIPPALTIYNLLFHPSLATLSQVCALLTTYKRAFEADMHSVTLPRATTNAFNGYLMDVANLLWRSRGLTSHDLNALACLCPAPLHDALNAYVARLETVPALAAAAAAANNSSSTTPTPATPPPPKPAEYTLTAHFSLPANHLTCAPAAAAFARLEQRAVLAADAVRHAPGPVSQRSLHRLAKAGGMELSWKAYRVEVLRWLEEKGVTGIRDFMFATMKDLMREAA